jgi:capsule biosynthesis phosphatase
MRRIIVDLDGTLTVDNPSLPYSARLPNLAVIAKLQLYRNNGFIVAIYTARNMKTYGGNIGQINAHTVPTIVEWLERHGVPYDELVVGKPWCGEEGFYVDDRAVRPSEFANLQYTDIVALIGREKDL